MFLSSLWTTLLSLYHFPVFSNLFLELKWENAVITSVRKKNMPWYLMMSIPETKKNKICYELTSMCHWLEGEVAALNVKGEFVHIHLTGAYYHMIIPKWDVAIWINRQKRVCSSPILLCPEWKWKTNFTRGIVQFHSIYHRPWEMKLKQKQAAHFINKCFF